MITTEKQSKTQDLKTHFEEFRENTIGSKHQFQSQYGTQQMLYADWIASGRLYRPIEDKITKIIGPMMANTHSFSSESGKFMTYRYHEARQIIKDHVHATDDDILVTTGTGMTAALAKLQRIMGLRNSIKAKDEEDRPVVFITHMEHHSNHVPWMETTADVVVLPPGKDLQVDPNILEEQLEKYKDRSLKIGSFTACSNVTGMITPYQELAKIMHKHNGFCFMDFAASAPYVSMDMHPEEEGAHLDAIFFSPHKFLGGPGTCGILVFNKKLYLSTVPDNPGGGNVKWTNPWGEHGYSPDAETREDGGTPGILQVMRTALVIRLKEKMNPEKMKLREKELLDIFYKRTDAMPAVTILGNRNSPHIGCVSFNIENLHYNLVVRLLNDRFGIQVRGGWSCASTYAHYLFGLEENASAKMIEEIECKDLCNKPGWVRVSLHPTMTDEEVNYITDAMEAIIENHNEWSKDYRYNPKNNEFETVLADDFNIQNVNDVFEI